MRFSLPITPWAVSSVEPYGPIQDRAIVGIRATGSFATPERFSFAWQATLTREAFLDQVPTSGGHNRIRADLLQELLAGLGRVIDENGGNVTMHYTTVGLVARR